MKKHIILLFSLFMIASFSIMQAQDIKVVDMDKSPMDAAHYPRRAAFQNYLAEDDADRTQKIKVLYCRPMKKDRDIFGGLEAWGKDWRLGANEATEVTFYQAVEINNTTIPRGTYTMFAQIFPDQWIIKLSTERFLGGVANRDISKDVVAVSVPTKSVPNVRESFTIGFQEINANKVHMIFEWDKTRAALPIRLNPPSMAGDDASPMDLVQFPNMSRFLNFVEEKDLAANEPQVRVVYSRPQMKGRTIFGELLPFGEMWRVGANETTEVTFFQDVTINGTKVPAGRYGLFATVNKDNWEFIIHKNVQSWGNANHDVEDNVVTVTAKTEKTPVTFEALSMLFVDKGANQLELVVAWENTMARLPMTVNK